jgi:transcription initiation factor TFIIIB Brf1 subunit/transcription initiation factor TFIIB
MMTPSQSSQSSQQRIGREQCRHPQVQVVSRDEETEYLRCRECGEVFESSELKDMAIEEKIAPDDET